MISRLQVNI